MIEPRLKGATRLLIRDVGGIEAAADILGMGHSQVGRYQQAQSSDFMSVLSAATLESQDGVRPHMSQAMAAIGKHILVPRPNVDGDAKWTMHLAATAKEAGDFLSGFGQALGNDGRIGPAEALALLPEVDQALSALMAVRRELEKQSLPVQLRPSG